MSRLTMKNQDICAWCDKNADCYYAVCDLTEMYDKLAHYEDLEEQGYKMVNINKIVEQLEIEKNVVKPLITPRGGKAFYEGTLRGLNKALKIMRGEVE